MTGDPHFKLFLIEFVYNIINYVDSCVCLLSVLHYYPGMSVELKFGRHWLLGSQDEPAVL